MLVDHLFLGCEGNRIAMLLPLGEYKHQKLKLAEPGDMVYDPEGTEARIVAKTSIFVESEIADCLSRHIYGRGIDFVKHKMEQKWDMQDDKILYLIIELI